MKFWYKGQLVRTSKTHDYNWAIVERKEDGGLKVYGCRAARAQADAEANRLLHRGQIGVCVVPLDKSEKTAPPPLTCEQFLDLAQANYHKGGGDYVETWDKQTFNEYVASFGPITEAEALAMFTWAGNEPAWYN